MGSHIDQGERKPKAKYWICVKWAPSILCTEWGRVPAEEKTVCDHVVKTVSERHAQKAAFKCFCC